MDRKKVIVIGAGPAGLTAAAELVRYGHNVTVFEAGPHIGGLSRSFELWNQKVDLGPHRFFSSDKIVNDFWDGVVKDEFTFVNRLTRIYYRKKFFHYPLKATNALFNLGVADTISCVLSYAGTKFKPQTKSETFEDWVVSRFGRRLFEIFFKTYTEKVWGISCKSIDADWAAQRIKKLSMLEVIKTSLAGNTGKHRSLLEQFKYPRNGTGSLYLKLANQIRAAGSKVENEKPVAEVLWDGNKNATGVRLADGTVHQADAVISTMPLTQMVKSLKGSPPEVIAACEKLYFRNTILVYLEIDSVDLFPDNWIYVHAPEVRHGRITNFRNWCPSLHGNAKSSILCMEYWCFAKDPIWSESAESLGELAKKELREINLLPENTKVLNTHAIKIPNSYPVYEIGYMKHVSIIQKHLDQFSNLLAIGRYGAFKYNNQDHSILMGILAARQIQTGQNQSLWKINTDSEYQESASWAQDSGLGTQGRSKNERP